MEALERRTMRKVTRRLIPLLALLYFVSYIDRTNLAFAGLTMNKDLGFSASVFGLGGALFFAGYLALQIPGALAIHRFGARRIITAMTLAWGVIGTAMAFVWSEYSFYFIRALLGSAESAFFPGAILYISLWFPAAYRGRIMAFFLLANPLSSVVGFPLSAALTHLDGALGLRGWQWVFIGEGLPAVVLAGVAWKYLTDVPRKATWLEPDEREWLVDAMAADDASRPHGSKSGISRAIFSLTALALAAGYFGIIMGIYGLNLWLPQLVRRLGFSITETGFVSAIPYIAATLAMLIAGLTSSTKTSMPVRATIAALVACIGFVVSTVDESTIPSMFGLSIAAAALFITLSAFWTIPTKMFGGTSSAAIIGFISSIGHAGGFVGPYLMGVFLDIFHNFTAGLIAMAAGLLVTAIVAWTYRGPPKLPTTA